MTVKLIKTEMYRNVKIELYFYDYMFTYVGFALNRHGIQCNTEKEALDSIKKTIDEVLNIQPTTLEDFASELPKLIMEEDFGIAFHIEGLKILIDNFLKSYKK